MLSLIRRMWWGGGVVVVVVEVHVSYEKAAVFTCGYKFRNILTIQQTVFFSFEIGLLLEY